MLFYIGTTYIYNISFLGTLHTCNPIASTVAVEDIYQAIESKHPLLPSTESNRHANQFGLGNRK